MSDAPARVMMVHNAYRQRGGEDAVVEREAALLRDAGIDVRVEIVSNDGIEGIAAKVGAFDSAARNTVLAKRVVDVAHRHRAELVHVHNFFPLVSPAAHVALAQAGLPVVQTLHNYRLLCANGMLERDGAVCRLCLEGSRINALKYRCYRGSMVGSAAVLRMQDASIRSSDWIASVDRFIALTDFAKDLFVDHGMPAEKIVVKGNFVSDPGEPPPAGDRNGALFVGRIAPGKGVDVLLDAWRDLAGIPLTIVGDGPDLEKARDKAPNGVAFVGRQDSEQVRSAMRRAGCLIVPSTWFEGFPMVIAEALVTGLPVIASRIGGLPEIVRDGRNGLLVEPASPAALAKAVRSLSADPDLVAALSATARADYLHQHSPGRNLARMRDIYACAVATARARCQ